MRLTMKWFRFIMQYMVLFGILFAPSAAVAQVQDSDFSPNSGGVQIGWANANHTVILFDEPDTLKIAMDAGWNALRDELANMISRFSDRNSTHLSITSELTAAVDAKLMAKSIKNGVTLKYLLSDNLLMVAVRGPGWIGDLMYQLTFDVELTLSLANADQIPGASIEDPSIAIRSIRVDGIGPKSDLFAPLFEKLIESVLAALGDFANRLLPLASGIVTKHLDVAFDSLGPLPLEGVMSDISLGRENGTITLCFMSESPATCEFR